MKLNNSEIKNLLKVYCILLVDYREQTNHIENFFSKPDKTEVRKRYNFVRFPLSAGDYSFMIMPNAILGNKQPISFHNDFVIEKKSGDYFSGGGFTELKGNLATKSGHKLFKKEFQTPIKSFTLLIENALSENDLFKCVRGLNNETFAKTFNSFINNRNKEREIKGLKPLNIVYCKQPESGLKVKELILEFFKSYLETI